MILAAVAIVSVSAAFFYTYEVRYVPTDSMDGEDQPYDIPSIPKGSAILVKKYSTQDDIDSLKVGDVILFYNTVNHLDTVHRIIDITGTDAHGHITQVKTKGDNSSGTELVNASDINGKVVGYPPNSTASSTSFRAVRSCSSVSSSSSSSWFPSSGT